MVQREPTLVLKGAAVVGGGPAGLMAAESLLAQGVAVDLFDAMPSVGRKFLLAGKGGLNLTHAEAFEGFVGRYAERADVMRPMLEVFGPAQVRTWAQGLGVETFVGSSDRVFPKDFKAAPLLRSWLHHLRQNGLKVHTRHRWLGWSGAGALRFDSPSGPVEIRARSTVLALGGGSWPQLGSDGAWVPELQAKGADVTPLRASNCGFDVKGWSTHLSSRFAGAPLKTVALQWVGLDGRPQRRLGECVLTATGLEGSLVYAASAVLRQQIEQQGFADIGLDLLPARDESQVRREIEHPRGSRSLGTHLQSRLKLDGAKAALLRELVPPDDFRRPAELARFIKALPVRLLRPRPLPEAISTAGGVRFECLTPDLMLQGSPGVFVAGEMLDWEAPTGGYLLTACLSTGLRAGAAAARWCLRQNSTESTD